MEEAKVDELTAGSPAPDFRLLGSHGQDVSLTEFRSKANVVLFFVREFN
jgi:peroxiredoxin